MSEGLRSTPRYSGRHHCAALGRKLYPTSLESGALMRRIQCRRWATEIVNSKPYYWFHALEARDGAVTDA